MHLRTPSVDQGVHAFVWAVVFFLYVWLGALLIGYERGTYFVALAALRRRRSFLFVRTRGGDGPAQG